MEEDAAAIFFCRFRGGDEALPVPSPSLVRFPLDVFFGVTLKSLSKVGYCIGSIPGTDTCMSCVL